MSKITSIQVLDIYLDTENPRHDPIDDQDKIIEYLLSKEKVKPLAKDIASHGLSPIELFAVLDDGNGRYIALEGNRRLCALILLNDPMRSPNSDRSYFQKLAESMSFPIAEVSSVIFNSREEADIWIDRRHEGQQEGIGIKQWNALQKTRRNLSRKIKDPNALSQALLQYATEHKYLSPNQTERILTTATRYLSNPFFRKTMGIVSRSNDPDVLINVSSDDFDKILEKFCNDLIDEESAISSRSTKDEREDYARKLFQEGFAPTVFRSNHKLSDRDSSDGGDSESEGTEQDSSARTNQDPDKRKHIIPSSGFSTKIKDKNLRRALGELKEISVQDFPLAIAMVCRVFLEKLYLLFYEKEIVGKSVKNPPKTHVVLEKVINRIKLDTALSRPENEALGALKRVQANENNVLSPKTLGANVHLSHYPNPAELNREWDNIQAILLYMLKKI